MRKNYLMKCLTCLAWLLVAVSAQAANYPKYPVQNLTDGQTYVLANLANPTGYMCRTTWDNALRIQGRSEFDSPYGVTITAHFDAEKSLWYFVTSEEQRADEPIAADEPTTVYTYLGIPAGTNNVRAMQVFDEIPYFEVVPGVVDGFYKLRVAEGHQHTPCIGVFVHLNGGGEYPVANERTNSWYPDFYGGVALEEDGQPVVEYDEDDNAYQVMADSTSCNWAFVAVEDIDAYNAIGGYWKQVNEFAKSSYCNDGSEYEAGFKQTLAAAEQLMAEGKAEEACAAIDAKTNLYKQLSEAQVLQEETSDLDSAIEAALEAFNTQTDAAALEAVTSSLKKACEDYSLGLGFITTMGQNMSFEDLSSQNGAPTNGVAGAPTGWNILINGKPVVTADDVRTAGIGAWHGINADCIGYKDREYGFGLWNNQIPEYELSQTISGLENGSYTITCGLMVGANGNGSRRTTQRVFGNYNSALFASEAEYDQGILPGELKEYAGLVEPTTDNELQEISVRAYVYDGTLTFGVRTNGDVAAALRDGYNAAGGDGWFKVDNFTIYKEGFLQEDQQNLYSYMEGVLADLQDEDMDANFKETLDNYDKSDLDKGITDMAKLIAEGQVQVAAYEKLLAAIELSRDRLEDCDANGYAGVSKFEKAIEGVEENYYDGVYTAEQIEGVVADLEQAYQDCLHSGASEGADLSDLIVNRSFENLSNQGGNNSDGVVNAPFGWTLKLNGVECQTADEIRAQGVTAWCAINSGDNINVEDNGVTYNHQYTDGTHVWGIWNAAIPQVELSQTLTGLKPGTYILTADVMARNTDWSGINLTTQRLFAQDVICMYASEADYDPEVLAGTSSDDVYQAYSLMEQGIELDSDEGMQFLNYADWNAYDNDILLRTLEVRFGVDESGEATIGFRTDNLDAYTGEARAEQAAGWFKLDNFTLYYESSKVPNNMKVGVEAPVIVNASKAVYDLSGRRVSKAQKGVYIMDGKKVVK